MSQSAKSIAAADQTHLSRYVRRLLTERRLSLIDVEMRSRGEVTDSHVANILGGNTCNPRIGTLKALAAGLGVAPWRLLTAARGLSGDCGFEECDFVSMFRRYSAMTEKDRTEIDALLDLLSREIDGLLSDMNIDCEDHSLRLSYEGDLSEYVRRQMAEKKLSLKDVEARSGGRIGHSYIHLIAIGHTQNVTVEKLCGLAAGLGVAQEEVFLVLCDISHAERSAFQSGEFARLFRKYRALTRSTQEHLRTIIETLDREVDRRHIQMIRDRFGNIQQEMALQAAR
jgi:transcriptional regulator with XRE-family HTH domain